MLSYLSDIEDCYSNLALGCTAAVFACSKTTELIMVTFSFNVCSLCTIASYLY